jgi:hypothetical protein
LGMIFNSNSLATAVPHWRVHYSEVLLLGETTYRETKIISSQKHTKEGKF